MGSTVLEPLMTAREVAEATRLARSTVYLLVHEGKIPCVKIGDSVRFSPSAIRAWLQAHTRPGDTGHATTAGSVSDV
jgi:excisionase family DNA binding protein